MSALTVALVALAVMPASDPQAALRQLAAYGEVPACALREVIVETPRDPRTMGGIVMLGHAHQLEPVKPLKRLRGRSGEILPFVEHSDRRVVQRAVDLLCSIQDAPSKRAIAALAAKYPCHRWLGEALLGARVREDGEEPRGAGGAGCEGLADHGEIPGSPDDWLRWTTPESRALGARLSNVEDSAFTEALSALHSIDLARVRVAAAALASIGTRPAWVRLARAFASRPPSGEYLSFVQGLAPHTLQVVATARKSPLEVELVEALRACPEIENVVWYLARSDTPTFKRLGALAERERQDGAATPAHLARFFERVGEEMAIVDPQGYSRVIGRIDALARARDKAALREFLRDEKNQRLHRLYAGSQLARLGELDGLDLFAEEASYQSSSAYVIKSELQNLLKETKGRTKARVQEILRLYETEQAKHPFEKVDVGVEP